MSDIELSGLMQTHRSGGDQRARLARAASMLEGVFLREMLKVMRRTVPESSLFGNSLGQGIYTEMFDGAVADEMSQAGGIGMQEMLLAQLGGKADNPTAHSQPTHRVPWIQPSRPMAASPAVAAARFQAVAQAQEPFTRGGAQAPFTGGGAPEPTIDGIGFDPPTRPEPVDLRDADGQLHWPLDHVLSEVDPTGQVWTTAGAEILAPGSGHVVFATADSVTVDHGNGLLTRIGALGGVEAQVGDLVLGGQALGKVGASGQFQIGGIKDGKPLEFQELNHMFVGKEITQAP